MNYSCILIDDDRPSLENLNQKLLSVESSLTVVNQFVDRKSAIQWSNTYPVDVIFLSVNLMDRQAMDWLEGLTDLEVEVVVTTNEQVVPITVLRLGVSGCLAKPVVLEELEGVVRRLERRMGLRKEFSQTKKVKDGFSRLSTRFLKIPFHVDRKIVYVPVDELLYCESDGNYCRVILERENELFLTRKLKQVEELLSFSPFYRVHNSFMINLRKVKEFYKNEGVVVLENGKEIPVSRQKRNDVLDRLKRVEG